MSMYHFTQQSFLSCYSTLSTKVHHIHTDKMHLKTRAEFSYAVVCVIVLNVLIGLASCCDDSEGAW